MARSVSSSTSALLFHTFSSQSHSSAHFSPPQYNHSLLLPWSSGFSPTPSLQRALYFHHHRLSAGSHSAGVTLDLLFLPKTQCRFLNHVRDALLSLSPPWTCLYWFTNFCSSVLRSDHHLIILSKHWQVCKQVLVVYLRSNRSETCLYNPFRSHH